MIKGRGGLFATYLVCGVVAGGLAVAAPFGGPPSTFEADTVISASAMNDNFDAVTAYLDELDARLTIAETLGGTPAEVPVGTVVAFAGPVVPDGWLLCDGAEVSREEFAMLFEAIGTVHGHGDGATTFHLPDYRGRFLRGVDLEAGRDPNSGARSAANTGGNTNNNIGSVQNHATARPSANLTGSTSTNGNHSHTITMFRRGDDGGSGNWNYANGGVGSNLTTNTSGNHSHNVTISGGGDAETRPKNAYVHFIIKT